MKYISNGKTRDRAAATAEIERFEHEITRQGWSRWAISLGISGPFIGYVGFAQKDDGIDFGGRTLPEFWGKPYTSIACHLAIEHGMTALAFPSIYAANHVDHYRAMRMTERFGFTLAGMTETPLGRYRRYELSRTDYFDKGIRQRNHALISGLRRRSGNVAAVERNPALEPA